MAGGGFSFVFPETTSLQDDSAAAIPRSGSSPSSYSGQNQPVSLFGSGPPLFTAPLLFGSRPANPFMSSAPSLFGSSAGPTLFGAAAPPITSENAELRSSLPESTSALPINSPSATVTTAAAAATTIATGSAASDNVVISPVSDSSSTTSAFSICSICLSSSSSIAASLASGSQSTGALPLTGEQVVDRVKMSKEVVNETCNHSPCLCEGLDGFAEVTSPGTDLSPYFKQLIPYPQRGFSFQNYDLINQILLKHGDITERSILNSLEAKTTILRLVAEVVALLCCNTLDTLGAREVESMQNWTDDAAAVGFRVDWLRDRIRRVAATSKFRESSKRLNEIGEEIDAAKAALVEMELQQMNLKKDVDLMKAEMEGNNGLKSSLSEGLL